MICRDHYRGKDKESLMCGYLGVGLSRIDHFFANDQSPPLLRESNAKKSIQATLELPHDIILPARIPKLDPVQQFEISVISRTIFNERSMRVTYA